MKKTLPIMVILVLFFCLASTQSAAVAGLRVVQDPDLTAGHTIRTSELLDRVVRNPQGHELGQVNDVVVNRDGRVAYIVVSGGETDNDQLIPVPFGSVRFGGYENWLVLSNMDKSKFEHAPSIRRDQWNRLEDPAFEREVFSYYGERMPR